MRINIDLPEDVIKLAEEQAIPHKWKRKMYIEQTVIKAVRDKEIALREGGNKK